MPSPQKVFQSTPPARAATLPGPFLLSPLPGFNPRRPRGRRLRDSPQPAGRRKFQSTPPARAATRSARPVQRGAGVSIHAAREGGDQGNCDTIDQTDVSIHAAREGGDGDANPARPLTQVSIHAAREGGDAACWGLRARANVSIHAAREGGDSSNYGGTRQKVLFQSTPPARAATFHR